MRAPSVYGFPKTADGLLPWSFADERLRAARNYWLATVRPDGRPHVTPVWGVWLDNLLYFDGPPTTRWSRNLATNPAAVIHLESGSEVVILEGTVEDLQTDAGTAEQVIGAWHGKYGRLEPEPATGGILRLHPRTARAWSTDALTDGTRWVF